jgi:hypothetical protein
MKDYRVPEASDGEEAVELARKSCPDLIMHLVNNPLPQEIQDYKNRYVWPIKTLYDRAGGRGAVEQIRLSEQLDSALSKYITFANEYAKSQPNYEELMEGALGAELEWAFDESERLRRMQDGDSIKAPVRKAGRRILENSGDD